MDHSNLIDLIEKIFAVGFQIVTLIGLIGNILAFLTFSRPRFDNTIFSTYFRFVIVSDSMSLLTSIYKTLEYFSINLVNQTNFACKFLWYSNFVLFQLSSWTMAVISVDRYLSIAFQSKFSFRKNKTCQLSICLFIFVFHMLFYSPILWTFNLVENNNYDNQTNTTTNIIYDCDFDKSVRLDLMDVFDGSVLPFSLMILFTILMLRTVFTTRKKTRSNHNKTITSSKTKNNKKQTKTPASTAKQKDIRFAMISVTLNIMFFVLTFPFYLFDLLTNFMQLDSYVSDFISSILFFFIYLNYGLLFYINILVNKMFRDEFYLLVTRKNMPISRT
jgi:hypothetical protein